MPRQYQLFRFRKNYFLFFLVLFFTEVLIAVFIHDAFIRPYVGDFLVVILVYCFARSFFRLSVVKAAIYSLLFSYTVEALQYFNIARRIGLQQYHLVRVVIGTSFEWSDLLAYTLGIGLVLLLERNNPEYSYRKQRCFFEDL